MSRTPSESELARALVDAAAEPSGEELRQLLSEHEARVERAFGLSIRDFAESLARPADARTGAVAAQLERARREQRELRAVRNQNLAVAAATMLAGLAKWRGERVELDVRIVLGRNLLADGTKKAVQFLVAGRAPINVWSAKLRRARLVLKFEDLGCFIEGECLRFSWHGGKGGLALCSQKLDRRDRDSVVPVVIVRPQALPRNSRPAFVDVVSRVLTDVCLA